MVTAPKVLVLHRDDTASLPRRVDEVRRCLCAIITAMTSYSESGEHSRAAARGVILASALGSGRRGTSGHVALTSFGGTFILFLRSWPPFEVGTRLL